MITRSQKIRLGVFVVFSASLLVVTLAILAGVQMAETRERYTVRFAGSVSGLEVGAQVKYNGVRVGAVEGIGINPNDVREVVVTLSLDAGTPIKADTKAVLNAAGITGLKFIELTLGSNDSEMLDPGSEIASGESFMDRITGQAEAIGQKAELLLNNLNRYMTDENRKRVEGILANIEDVSASAAHILEDNRENLRAISSSLAETAAGLDRTVSNVETEVAATLAAIRSAAEKLSDTVDPEQIRRVLDGVERLAGTATRKVSDTDVEGLVEQLKTLTGESRELVGHASLTLVKSREDIFASLSYLQEGMENFAELVRILRENPSLLLTGPSEQERQL